MASQAPPTSIPNSFPLRGSDVDVSVDALGATGEAHLL